MVSPSVVPKDSKDIGPYYTSDEQVLFFRTKVGISSSEDEKMFILEACLPTERVTMLISFDPPSLIYTFTSLLPRIWGFSSPFPLCCGGSEGYQNCALPAIP